MSYIKGKSIEKQRGNAIKEIILEHRTVSQAARRYGHSRSTIYRWLKKWHEQNPHLCFSNYNRPNRPVGITSHTAGAKWSIATINCRPKTSPHTLEILL